jgi:hypothetical protein
MSAHAEPMVATAASLGSGLPARKRTSTPTDFSQISLGLAELLAARDKLMMDAFSALEQTHAQLAEMLVQRTGSRCNAARWMCKHQESFRGLTGYDVLAEGDADCIWDEIVSP